MGRAKFGRASRGLEEGAGRRRRRRGAETEAPRVETVHGFSDPEAFSHLVQRYENLLFKYVFNIVRDYHLTQDLTQEIFVKVARNFSAYNSRYTFSTWLLKVAHNHAVDFLRKRRVETVSMETPTEGGALAECLPADCPPPSHAYERTQTGDQIKTAIFALPLEYRSVIVLRYLDGVKLEEIAWILNVPLGTVKSRINRARQLLQSRLGSLWASR